MSGELAGRVAIVTGAGTESTDELGIGAATAVLFAREGAKVVIFNRSPERAQRTVDLIIDSDGSAAAVAGLVENASDCQRAAQSAVDNFGHVDVLINCVGTTGSDGDDEQNFRQIMDTNVLGMMHMADAFVSVAEREFASIVNIASIAAWRPNYTGSVAYNISKAAVLGLTATLAVRHGADGIRANTISAGGQWTPTAARTLKRTRGSEAAAEKARLANWRATLLQREGTAWDVANAAVFLASPRSRWITGVNLVVDGGATVAPRTIQDRPDPA